MEFYSLLGLYIILLLIFLFLFKDYGVSLYTSVFFVYTLLICIPFFLIFAEVEGIFYISEILNRKIDAKVSLSLGNGYKPIIYILVFNTIYVFFGFIFRKKFKSIKPKNIKYNFKEDKRVYKIGIYIFIISLVYIATRYILYPDFPLFVLLSKGVNGLNLRDVAFYYGSNTNIPYVFLPSINSQFYRILLPVSLFIILFYNKRYKKISKSIIFIFIFIVLAMNIGTLKRTPILYISTWYILYLYMYSRNLKSLLNIVKYIIVTIAILIFITSNYTDKSAHEILLNLFARFSVGEAIGEFLAIEHFGNTFDLMYYDIYTVYFQKVLGMSVMTFSELWKILSGGTRGYTSIGVIAEFFVSFGWLSIVYIALYSLIIVKLDILFKRYSDTYYRPIIAGLITIISYMMVKGLLSQFFTGGVVALLIVSFFIKKKIKFYRRVNV